MSDYILHTGKKSLEIPEHRFVTLTLQTLRASTGSLAGQCRISSENFWLWLRKASSICRNRNLYLVLKLHNPRNHHSHFSSSLWNSSLSHSLLHLSFLRPNSPEGSTRWDLTCRILTTCLCWCPCSQTAHQRVSGISYCPQLLSLVHPSVDMAERKEIHSGNLEGHIDINYPLLLPAGSQVLTEFKCSCCPAAELGWEPPLLSICIHKRHKSKHPKCYCLSLNKCYQCTRRLWSLLTTLI